MAGKADGITTRNSENGANKMRQLLIARKDLQMSPGKLAAQVSHASMAFLTMKLRDSVEQQAVADDAGAVQSYRIAIDIDRETWDGWINGIFTKTVCEAKNQNQLMKAADIAAAFGLKENVDYFLIKDNCLTELELEEVDEDGVGRTLTCIGFRPLPDDIAHQISKKYQLYQ